MCDRPPGIILWSSNLLLQTLPGLSECECQKNPVAIPPGVRGMQTARAQNVEIVINRPRPRSAIHKNGAGWMRLP